MKLIELEVADIHNSLVPTEAFALILKEKNGTRCFPIVIGNNEAKAIVLVLSKMKPRRPSTHDLFVSLANRFNTKVNKITIYKYDDGIYFSKIQLTKTDISIDDEKKILKKTLTIDARTSDAVTLALKYNAPIFIKATIFNENAIEVNNPTSSDIDSDSHIDIDPELFIDQKLSEMNLEELDELLNGAIESEDYELASKIHTEIGKRK